MLQYNSYLGREVVWLRENDDMEGSLGVCS